MRAAHLRLRLAALVALLFCAATIAISGCGGTKPTQAQAIQRYSQSLREAVTSKVPQEDRKNRMLLIVDQVEALHLRFSQETVAFVQSYRKLNTDYDAPRATFDQLFADYEANRMRARSEALDLHFQLASLATAQEWDSIGKAEEKLYEEVNASRPAGETVE
jgi:hypothetical protein